MSSIDNRCTDRGKGLDEWSAVMTAQTKKEGRGWLGREEVERSCVGGRAIEEFVGLVGRIGEFIADKWTKATQIE